MAGVLGNWSLCAGSASTLEWHLGVDFLAQDWFAASESGTAGPRRSLE
jgi:hypothetical protein